MRPHEYLLVLLRNWLVIAVTVLIGLGAGFGVSRVQPTAYDATAQVLFTGHAAGGQDLAYVGTYTQGRLTTYQRLAGSTSVLALVKRDLGTAESISSLRSRVSLSTVQATSIISVRAISATRADAKATAAAVAARLKSSVEFLENGATPKSDATVEATIISKAEASADPVSPNLPLDLLVGALAGLAISAGVVTVREALRAGRRGAPELD